MSLGRIGRHGGRAVAGFYRGQAMLDEKRRREEAEADRARLRNWEEEDRMREVGVIRPREDEMADLRLQGARREDDYSQYVDPLKRRAAERADLSGGRTESYEQYMDPLLRRDADRRDRAGARQDELETASQPYRMGDLARQDRMRGYAEDSARYGSMQQGMRLDQEAKYQEAVEVRGNFMNAVAQAKAGNVRAMEDFYNNYVDDGGVSKITRLPDGNYLLQVQYANGQTEESISDQETMVREFEELFSQLPIFEYLQTGFGGGYGYGGRRGRYGAPPSPYAKSKNPVQQIGDFYDERLSELMPERPSRLTQRNRESYEEAVRYAEQTALEMTIRRAERIGFSEQDIARFLGGASLSGRGGDRGTVQKPPRVSDENWEIVIRMLQRNPTPEAMAQFDEAFGDGMAEAVLNGN